MIPGFRPREVVKLTGVPYSTLNLWAKTNFIVPTLCKGEGTGHERIYDKDDVEALTLAYSLKRSGLSKRVMIDAITHFAKYPKSKSVTLQLCYEPLINIEIWRPNAAR